jgi:UDP-3-O-[3-hydroxymyristoyl] glucosamine N-acyltransferase
VTTPAKTLFEIAKHVGGRVIGDGGVIIRRVSPIDEAGTGDITFLANPRYRRFLTLCKATAIIVGPGVASEPAEGAGQSFLEAAHPYLAFARVLQLFTPPLEVKREISPLAYIASSATVEEEVAIFPHVFVGEQARVGRRTLLYPGVFLGRQASVGEECVLHANVVVREGCRLGNRVVLHPGVVIGSDGFGYAGEGNARVKIPQVGSVVVEDDVEIGANSTVDRATLGRTVIGRGTKVDNLVQIAHNVTIGENSIIAAQAGIAGSARIGRDVTVAGQAGIINHVAVGDGAKLGPRAGIVKSVAPGAVLSSAIAAVPHHQWLKVMTLLPQLPRLWNSVRKLEKKMSSGRKKNER